jgi:hypothetical protein
MVKLANPTTAWWLSSMMIDNDGHRIDALRCRGAHRLSGDVTAKTLLLRARQGKLTVYQGVFDNTGRCAGDDQGMSRQPKRAAVVAPPS